MTINLVKNGFRKRKPMIVKLNAGKYCINLFGYEPATIVSDRKNIFKAEVFFRRTEHEAHLCINANYSYKVIPVYWNELEFCEEGFKENYIVPLGISLTGDQIKEYFPVWSETPHTVKEVV